MAIAMLPMGATPALGQTNWNVTMGDVRVISQCEPGGDRPYFPAIYFSSKINTPNSTIVEVVEYEPHDWVSKDPFKSGLPGGKDHMFTGNDLRLPFWMSPHQFRGIQSVHNPMVNGKLDSSLANAAMHAEIVGAIVLGIDNRNTPPDVVRELLNDGAKIVRQLLIDQVESGKIILPAMSGDFTVFEKNVIQDATDLATKLLDGWSVAGLIVRGGIGSLGSPDQLLGLKGFILPAIDGITWGAIQPPQNAQIAIPIVKGSLTAHNEVMDFQGSCSNGHYQVALSITPEICNPAERISALAISVLSGEDDLRSNSVVGLRVEAGGKVLDVPNFITNTGIDKRQQLTRTVTLPNPVLRSELRTIGLTFTSHSNAGQTPDNWDMAAIRVDANGKTVVLQTGRPVMRFTGNAREWTTGAGCTPPSRFSTTPPPMRRPKL
ncbi:MAG TPA: hypothetical protein VLA83_13390 [Candidatus Binatia bacterium]|nr:hypothetical protein [Candidatus Binatia bacterium]